MKKILFVALFFNFLNLSTSMAKDGSFKSDLPRILIIGDSISLAYTSPLTEILKDEAIVRHHPGNAGPTMRGVEYIGQWIGSERWDVIHFNWSLWDMYGWQYEQVDRSPAEYAKRLDTLVLRLKKTNAKLIWATTTPICPEPEAKCKVKISPATEREYLEAALQVMKDHNVQVNDLHAFMSPRWGQYSLAENNVHFTKEGSRALAEQIARQVRVGLKGVGEGNSLFLDSAKMENYVTQFNADDEELYANIPNKDAFIFLEKNVPRFECPDPDIERTYYFRWWTYRKHVRKTEDGYVITEFLPKVSWSGKHNTISCPAGHHYYEGRWLHNPAYLDDYSVFWLRKGGDPRRYSFWIADAFYARNLVTPNEKMIVDLLPDLIKNYQAWETGWKWGNYQIGQRENGLFATIDDRDGSEMSIAGHGFRPTLNSYMYGDAKAIASISRMAGETEQAQLFEKKAARLKALVQEKLWDKEAQFFKVLSDKDQQLADVRELHGYLTWYFNLPDPGYEAGWKELMDPSGFHAPYGPTFTEQRHPKFIISYQGHECQWNGPSWPMATAGVLTGFANLLNNYEQDVVDRIDYFETLKIYTKSHTRKRDDGKVVPWIDENLNPFNGDWISRTRLKAWKDGTWNAGKGGKERGKDYNHSSYNDLIITGLVGLRPRADNVVEVNPLLPEGTWDYFCLDNVLYHGNIITIIWDKTGKRYGKGKGLTIWADGKEIAKSKGLSKTLGTLR